MRSDPPQRLARLTACSGGGDRSRTRLAVVVAGGPLVALAIPAFQMKAVTSGVDDRPQSIPAIATYNKIKAVLPARAWRPSLVVEADNVRSGATADAITALRNRVKRSDAFRPGTKVDYSRDDTVAEITVPTGGTDTDPPARWCSGGRLQRPATCRFGLRG